jgi:hypothetical protein
MQSSSNSKEYSESLGAMQSYLKSDSTKEHSSQNQDFYDSLKNDFVKSQNASKSYQEAQQRYDSYSQQRNEYAEQSQRINENLTPKFMEWVKFKKGNAGAEEIFKKGDAGTLSSLANRFIEDNGLNSPINSTTYKSKEHSNNPDSAFMGQSFFSSGFGTASKAHGESVSDTVNEKLSGGINEDSLDKKYKSNVGDVKEAESKYTGDLTTGVEGKDAALQPIEPKKDSDNNQQSVTNNSSSQNNEAPNNPDNINPVGQSSINAQVDSNENKIKGGINNQNDEEITVFESNYQAPNAFAGNIHKTVGQNSLNEKSAFKKQQNFTNNQLGQKRDAVGDRKNELDTKSKDNINKGVRKNMGRSIIQDAKDNVNDNITAVKNAYFDVTGQSEKKQEYSKIDKPAINLSGDDLKIQDNNDKDSIPNPQNVTSNNQAQDNQASLSAIKQDYEIVNKSNNSQSIQNSALKQNKNLSSNIQNEDKNIANLKNAENKDKTTPNLLKQSSNNATSQQGALKQNMSADKSGKKNNKNEDK